LRLKCRCRPGETPGGFFAERVKRYLTASGMDFLILVSGFNRRLAISLDGSNPEICFFCKNLLFYILGAYND
jgi:hypothetical protein